MRRIAPHSERRNPSDRELGEHELAAVTGGTVRGGGANALRTEDTAGGVVQCDGSVRPLGFSIG